MDAIYSLCQHLVHILLSIKMQCEQNKFNLEATVSWDLVSRVFKISQYPTQGTC